MHSSDKPGKLTSGAYLFAEFKLISSHLKSSPSLILRLFGKQLWLLFQQSDVQKQIFAFYIHQKPFYLEKCEHDHDQVLMVDKEFVLKSLLNAWKSCSLAELAGGSASEMILIW